MFKKRGKPEKPLLKESPSAKPGDEDGADIDTKQQSLERKRAKQETSLNYHKVYRMRW